MIAAATAARARSATVTTWITTPPTPPRSSSISTCATPSTSAIRPAAARRRAMSRATASPGPRRQAGADRRRAADHGEDAGQSRRPADRGVRRLAQAARRQPRAVLPRSRERPVLRLQPAGREAVAGRHPQLVAPGHDGRRQGALRRHQGLLGDRLHRGSEDHRRADARHARRRRPDRADRRLRAALGEAAQEQHAQGLREASRTACARPMPTSSTPTCWPSSTA